MDVDCTNLSHIKEYLTDLLEKVINSRVSYEYQLFSE